MSFDRNKHKKKTIVTKSNALHARAHAAIDQKRYSTAKVRPYQADLVILDISYAHVNHSKYEAMRSTWPKVAMTQASVMSPWHGLSDHAQAARSRAGSLRA